MYLVEKKSAWQEKSPTINNVQTNRKTHKLTTDQFTENKWTLFLIYYLSVVNEVNGG